MSQVLEKGSTESPVQAVSRRPQADMNASVSEIPGAAVIANNTNLIKSANLRHIDQKITNGHHQGVKRKSESAEVNVTKRTKLSVPSVDTTNEAFKLFVKLYYEHLDGEDLINLSLTCKTLYTACAKTPLWAHICLRNAETLSGHLGTVNVITTLKGWAFSGSSDGKIKLWDVEKWECLRTLQMSQPVYTKQIRQGVRVGTREATSPSAITALEARGECLFTGLEQGQVVMNILVRKDNNSTHSKREHGHSGKVNCLKVEGPRLFSAGNDGKVSVFDSKNLNPLKQLRPYHKRAVIALEVSCNKLFSGSEDGNVMVWDITTDKLPLLGVLTPPGVNFQVPYPYQPNAIKMDITHSQKLSAMCSYKERLFTCGWDCELKLWDCNTLSLLKTVFLNPLSICWCLKVRETDHLPPHLLCSVRDGEIELRNINDLYLMQGTTSPKCNWSLGVNGHRSWVNTILCLKDGRIVTGSDDWTLKVWHVIDSEHDKKYTELKNIRLKNAEKKRESLRELVLTGGKPAKSKQANGNKKDVEVKKEGTQPEPSRNPNDKAQNAKATVRTATETSQEQKKKPPETNPPTSNT